MSVTIPLMIILVDMDEVLADFEGKLREIWDSKYPHTPLFENGVRDSFYIGAGDKHGRWDLVQKIIHAEGFFAQLEPVKGSKEAIDEISRMGHYVFILTSPGVSYPNAAGEKYNWVARHYGTHMLERLIITPAKPMIRGNILIDDRPELPHEDKAMWEHVLYDRSYNKTVEGKRRLTWENWKEVLSEVTDNSGAPTET
jgi:5'-nucleotidase